MLRSPQKSEKKRSLSSPARKERRARPVAVQFLVALLLVLVLGACQQTPPAPAAPTAAFLANPTAAANPSAAAANPTPAGEADVPAAAGAEANLPPAEMAPEEALLLALECQGNLVSNTIEYTFREGTRTGFNSAAEAFAGYTPLSELPLGQPAFEAANEQLVVRVYQEEGRYVGKTAAEVGPDGSWVVSSIVRCLE